MSFTFSVSFRAKRRIPGSYLSSDKERLGRKITDEVSERRAIRIDTRLPQWPGSGLSARWLWKRAGLLLLAILFFICLCVTRIGAERSTAKDLRAGNVVVVEGELGKISERPMRGSRWRRLASGWLNFDGRQIRVVWFNLPAYMRGYLPGGERVLVRGRVAADGGRRDRDRAARGASVVGGRAESDSAGLPIAFDCRTAALREFSIARPGRAGRFDPRRNPRRIARRSADGPRGALLPSRST